MLVSSGCVIIKQNLIIMKDIDLINYIVENKDLFSGPAEVEDKTIKIRLVGGTDWSGIYHESVVTDDSFRRIMNDIDNQFDLRTSHHQLIIIFYREGFKRKTEEEVIKEQKEFAEMQLKK
jgi:hypothetical protein